MMTSLKQMSLNSHRCIKYYTQISENVFKRYVIYAKYLHLESANTKKIIPTENIEKVPLNI